MNRTRSHRHSGSAAGGATARPPARDGDGGLPLAMVAGLALCAGFAYEPIFGWRPLVVPVGVSAGLPVLLAWALSARRHFPLSSAAASSALLGMCATCATLFRSRAAAGFLPTPALSRTLGRSLADAPKALLGTVLPAPAEAHLLVLVFATVWVCAFGGAELALRSRAVALPVLPPAVLLAGVPLVGPGGSGPAAVPTAAAVVLGALLVAHRAAPTGERAVRIATALPLAAALALVAACVAPRLPGTGRHALDLRSYADRPPPVAVEGVSPLDRVSAWLRDPGRPMFSVTAPGADTGQLWRLTVLDRYDGVSWRPVRELVPSGGRVPPADDVGGPVRNLTQHFTLAQLPGPWLPSADRPEEVDVAAPADARVAVDPADGVLAGERGLPPGSTYTVRSRIRELDPGTVQFAPPADDRPDTELPFRTADGQPIAAAEALRALAQDATRGATFPYQQALRLADWLRSRCRFDPDAVPGHGYRNLQFFLESSRTGTSEQFAGAFAVMARALDLPARVVVGFRSGVFADGRIDVRAGDVLAWAEVRFAGVGWVSFFPTPSSGPAAAVLPPQDAPQPEPTPAAADGTPDGGNHRPSEADIRDQERSTTPAAEEPGAASAPSWRVWLAASLGAAGVAAGAAAAVPAFRRRARRRGPPERRILGAWARAGELLRSVGLPDSGALTATEVADYGRARLGPRAGDAAAVLADLCNDLAFASGPSPERAEATAALAWKCCAEIDRAVRAERRAGRRLLRGDRVLRAVGSATVRSGVGDINAGPPPPAASRRTHTGSGATAPPR